MEESDFSLKDTLFSGQCFRVNETDGIFTVICGTDKDVKKLSLRQENTDNLKSDLFWSDYFDLNTDYEAMKKRFSEVSPVMAAACSFSPGIRILRQDPWEALCSFVVSQNNNIKRIMGIVDRMCRSFGFEAEDGLFGFPKAEVLACASEESLRAVGLGFRAPYIQEVAKAVCDGRIDLDYLKTAPIDDARSMLIKVKGIGPKVADCALLFGCHRLDCFPMDVWMKKVMKTWFPGCTKEIFGENSGVAQQYLFHYARTGGCNDF